MKAVTIWHFGGPDVLELTERPNPEPGPGEIRIRTAAATVNPTDVALRTGARRPDIAPPYIPGMELSGEIDKVGPGTSDKRPGQKVFAIALPMSPRGGAQAELVLVPSASAAPVPDGLSLLEAATLPMNGLTARRALNLLALPPGATLAITGAAGAVGGYAIQLAKLAGLRVIADAKPADEALVRALGADLVVPRGEGVGRAIRDAHPPGVDGLIDAAVQGEAILDALADGGRIAALRSFEGQPERAISVLRVAVTDDAQNQEALLDLARLAGSGSLTPRVARTFTPSEAPQAHRALEAGGVRGRLVIVF